MTNYIEFATKIKEKYPEYKDIDDLTLAQKIVEKYPEYKEKVTFDDVKTVKQSDKKGIDLTPSGMIKNTLAATLAPLRGAIYKEDLGTARENALNNVENFKPLGGAGDFLADMAVYSRIPMLKGAGAGKFIGNAALQGGLPGVLESMKRDGSPVSGGVAGTGIAAALQGIPYVGKGISKAIQSDAVQKGLPKALEFLTSVPAEYTERALEKELAGQSILNGKFNAKTAYRPIEEKLTEAKNLLPTKEDFAQEYFKLGKRASEGLENLKTQAGQNISEMLGNLSNNSVNIKNLKNAINSNIKSYAKGGNINPAEIRAGRDIEQINQILGENATPIDLHNTKELLYDMANYDTAGGMRNDVIKGVANQINNYLRKIEPGYAKPNDIFSTIKGIEKEVGGLNPNTIGTKISNIGGKNNALSGLDIRLKNIDNILPEPNKFYKQAQEIKTEEDAINEINNAITQKYLDNARPLADKSSIRFENAINDLQKKTGIDFADKLKDTRAREALEKVFPGQGGGSGTSEGFGNLLRTALIGGSPTAAVLTGNPAALLGLATVSPKIMAKGTIKNIGKLQNTAQKAAQGAYNEVINRLSNLGAKGAANLLFGGANQ